MTQEEQMQVNALANYFQRQCGNLALEGANAAFQLEASAQKIKALEAELAALKAAEACKKESNVTPITAGESA